MSIVLGGKQLEIPGVVTVSYADDPRRVPRATDGSPRTTWARALVAHSDKGLKGRLAPGSKPSDRDQILARYQANTGRAVSWDFTVDTDGSVAWSNDPLERFTWHASQTNPYTVGFEMVQDADGTMYRATIDAAVRVIDFLTEHLGIQRQIYAQGGMPFASRIPRLDPSAAGRNLCGIYGHRNAFTHPRKTDPTTGRRLLGADGKPVPDTTRFVPMRGFGDPNDHLFIALKDAGYDAFDPLPDASGDPEDVRVWKDRQRRLLGFTETEADGVPGPRTRAALRLKGYADGVFVARPSP